MEVKRLKIEMELFSVCLITSVSEASPRAEQSANSRLVCSTSVQVLVLVLVASPHSCVQVPQVLQAV